MRDKDQNILFIFPGQGSQYPGMGSDLHAGHEPARKIYQRAGEVLGYDIAELSFRDPEGKLNLTRYTQPALLTHSVACLETFRDLTDDRVKPVVAGGHSLGEYSALVAAGALGFETALNLVAKRGDLMGTHGQGEMTAFPLEAEVIGPMAGRHHCAIAGCNLPQQTVVGGRADDLSLVEQEVQEQFPRKRPVRLKTEGAFHTYYMVKAAQHFRDVLDGADFDLSGIRVLSNYSGDYHSDDPQDVRSRLFFQLFHPVLWYSNLQTAFADDIGMVVEFGGGIGNEGGPESKRPNLEGMIKKTLRLTGREANYMAVINQSTLDAAVAAVAGF